MDRCCFGRRAAQLVPLVLLVVLSTFTTLSAHAQYGSGAGYLYPSYANPFAPRPSAPSVQPPRPRPEPRPYRGYWNEVGYQWYGFGEGAVHCGHFMGDLAYGGVQVVVWGVSLGNYVPPNPGSWQSAGITAYDQRCKNGEQFAATAEMTLNACTFGIPAIAQGLGEDLCYGTNNTMQNLGGIAAGAGLMEGCAVSANAIRNARCYKVVDLMGGPESQIPGALNIDAQCLPGKGIKVPEGPTVQTGLPPNSVSEIVCSNPQAAFLEECARILRPGGKLYVNYTKGNKFGLTEKPGVIRPKYNDPIAQEGLEVELAGGPLDPKFNCLKMARTDGTPFEPGTSFYTTILTKPSLPPRFNPMPGFGFGVTSQPPPWLYFDGDGLTPRP